MAGPNTGMDRAEMKKLLMHAKEEPVSCAIGMGDVPNFGLLLMHKTKSPKVMEGVLKEEFPVVKNPRFGTAFVDVQDDAKRVRFTLNRQVSGMAKKLVKTLKGTGYTKVIILLEDGSLMEQDEEEDETLEDEGGAQVTAGGTAPVIPAGGVPAPPPPPPPAASPTDTAAKLAALAKLLATLAPKIPEAAGDDAARKATLLKLATDANVQIKTGNLASAANFLDQLRRGLAPGQAGTAATGTTTPTGDTKAPGSFTLQDVMASRQQWASAQVKVRAEVDKLGAELSKTYKDTSYGGEITTAFRTKTAAMVEHFDDQLLDVLDDLANTADPTKRATLVGQARGLIKTYLSFAMSDALIGELDDNPFVKLAIRPTVTGTLASLAKTLQ